MMCPRCKGFATEHTEFTDEGSLIRWRCCNCGWYSPGTVTHAYSHVRTLAKRHYPERC